VHVLEKAQDLRILLSDVNLCYHPALALNSSYVGALLKLAQVLLEAWLPLIAGGSESCSPSDLQ
jgi:hypothetical protein